MKRPTHRARAALAVIALTCTALAGCGGSSSSESRASARASASASASEDADSGGVQVLDKESSGTGGSGGESAQPSVEPSASASASASSGAGSSGGLAAPAAPPAGYQTATAEKAGITFAVPAEWYVYTTLDDTEVNEIAVRLDADPSEISTGVALQDLIAMPATRDANGLMENLICSSFAFNLGVRDEATMTQEVTEDGGTVEKYSTLETANGTGVYIIYSESDSQFKSANLYVPNPEGNMVYMRISSASSERTQEIIDNIGTSLR